MEVHVPDHPVMTWKQFFVHMGIVVLGLLIAVSLEQTVEWLHRRHQRAELREAIHRDLEQIAQDAESSYEGAGTQIENERVNLDRLRVAKDSKTAYQPFAKRLKKPIEPISDPAFKAARSSGLLALLPQDEVRAFSEMDKLVEETNQESSGLEAFLTLRSYVVRFAKQPNAMAPWDKMSPQEIDGYMNAVSLNLANAEVRQYENAQAYQAAKALLNGERDLQKIYAAERLPMPSEAGR